MYGIYVVWIHMHMYLVMCVRMYMHGQLGYGDMSARGNGPNEMNDTLTYVNLQSGRTVKQIS